MRTEFILARIGFCLYITACYVAIALGSLVVEGLRGQNNKKKGRAESASMHGTTGTQETLGESASADHEVQTTMISHIMKALRRESGYFYPTLVIVGIVLLVLVGYTEYHVMSRTIRGTSIFFLFAAATLTVSSYRPSSAHGRLTPTVSVFMATMFFGGLFWFMDNYIDPQGFINILERSSGPAKHEIITFLYAYVKDSLTLVTGFFLGIAITFTLGTVQYTRDTEKGQGRRYVAGWAAWLVFWGGLGWLGGVGGYLGWCIRQILDRLGNS